MFPCKEQLIEYNYEDDEEKCVEVAETNNKWKRTCIEEGEFDDISDEDNNSY